MTDTLTARLLAEIERREGNWRAELEGGYQRSTMAAYLTALRKIVDRHRVYVVSGDRLPICAHCDRRHPCVDLMDVASALDVIP